MLSKFEIRYNHNSNEWEVLSNDLHELKTILCFEHLDDVNDFMTTTVQLDKAQARAVQTLEHSNE